MNRLRGHWWVIMCLAIPAARADEPEDALREAVAAARSGDVAAAAALPPASSLAPRHMRLIREAADALRDQRPDVSVHLLASARRLEPDALAPRQALEAQWMRHPEPASLHRADLPLLPVEAETMTLPAAEGLPGPTIATVAPGPYLAIPPAVEKRGGRAYAGLVCAYAGADDPLVLRIVLRYAEGVEPALARRVARFLAALSALSDAALGDAGRVRYPVRVWLSRDGPPDAEQWAGEIAVRGASFPRSDLEWARQLAHEWGHATLPGPGGFTAPEAWPSGDLGERLYLSALSDAGWRAAWSDALNVAPYLRLAVDPLIAAFAKSGPVPLLAAARDAEGYRHYLGAALYVNAAYGPRTLARSLHTMDGQRTVDFLDAVTRAIRSEPGWTVKHPGAAPGPTVVCFPTDGVYMLEGRDVRREGRPLDRPSRFSAGWTALEWTGSLTIKPLPPTAETRKETHGRHL